jgi:hypothetical protein
MQGVKLRRWCIIQKEEVAAQLEGVKEEWEQRGARPPLLPWCPRDQATNNPTSVVRHGSVVN